MDLVEALLRSKQEKLEKIKKNEFLEELLWCPSQIYYYFQDKSEKIWCLYLRWRHDDPWTSELIPCDKNFEFLDCSKWETISTSKDYKDFEYKDLEKEVLEIIKKKFPDTNFPE